MVHGCNRSATCARQGEEATEYDVKIETPAAHAIALTLNNQLTTRQDIQSASLHLDCFVSCATQIQTPLDAHLTHHVGPHLRL